LSAYAGQNGILSQIAYLRFQKEHSEKR